MSNILIVAAHADDEVLGCGGTIARHVNEDDTVNVIYMADGVTSRCLEKEDTLESRRSAAQKANHILGVNQSFYLDFPDNKMDSIPLLEIVNQLEALILELNPEVVYTHHYGDLNIDHRITHNAILTACRPQPNLSVKSIYSFEVMSSTEWNSPEQTPFHPNHFVDISPYIELKIEALMAYQEEMNEEPHSRSIEHLQSLAKHRGHSMGLNSAEAFMVIRQIQTIESV